MTRLRKRVAQRVLLIHLAVGRLLVARCVVVCVLVSRPPTLTHTHSSTHPHTGRDTHQYFVMTVFSTVGFGDVTPDNSVERASCVALMLGSILVFGNLLAEVPCIICRSCLSFLLFLSRPSLSLAPQAHAASDGAATAECLCHGAVMSTQSMLSQHSELSNSMNHAGVLGTLREASSCAVRAHVHAPTLPQPLYRHTETYTAFRCLPTQARL